MQDSTLIRRGRMIMLAGASAIALGAAVFAPAARTEAATVPGALQSYADIVAQTKPAVVTVKTEVVRTETQAQGPDGAVPPEEFFRRFFGENGPMPGAPEGEGAPQRGMGLGSGFVISADGYVVTNFHVVDHAEKIRVTMDDGTELDASLVGHDAKADIAVLKVTSDAKLPVAAWGDSDVLRAGDPVIAIGNPFGIGTTVTAGIISARGRDLHNGPYDDFLQVDAAINHGNSGGPLLNERGEVVGINTAIYSPNGGNVGVGFAIPSDQAKAIVDRIIETGASIAHGYIGVSIQPVDPEIAEAVGLDAPKGALVAEVVPGAPASEAGVKQGDVIVSVNGTVAEEPRDVSRMIADIAPGGEATLGLWRGGEETKVTLKVGELDGEKMAAAEAAPEGKAAASVPELGIEVAGLTADDRAALGLGEDETGVVVTDVDAAGTGAEKGLQSGDVILSVNQTPVASGADVEAAVKAAASDDRSAALLLVARGGQRSFVAVPFRAA